MGDPSETPRVKEDESDKAYWEKGSIVEIWSWLKLKDRKGEYSDPNLYAARCMTSGTFPMIEVIDESTGERHENFPMPLFEGQYCIWRVLV